MGGEDRAERMLGVTTYGRVTRAKARLESGDVEVDVADAGDNVEVAAQASDIGT
jgi:hypothetical protein